MATPGRVGVGRSARTCLANDVMALDGNHAVGVDLSGQRVLDRPAEDPLALLERRDAGEHQRLRDLPEAFVVGEEERAVPDDRPAEHETELVPDQLRLHAVGRLEEPDRVERVVAVELPERAAERVGAAAHRRVDDGAAGAAELGAEVVGLHLELLDRVGRHLHELVREALVAGAVGVVVHAVEDEAVDGAAEAVDVEGRVAGLGDGRAAHAGAEEREVRIRASVQREVDDLLLADDLSAIARLGLEQFRGAGHDDRLADVADRQREIDSLARVDRHGEVLRLGRRESLELGAHAVGADPDVEELIVPALVAHRRGGDAGAHVLQRHRGSGHDRAGGITDGAEHGRGIELRERARGEQEKRDEHGRTGKTRGELREHGTS